MAPKTLTIKDIADACGVSPATVSYVINNKSIVRQETRERVLKVIEQLNYRPNALARSLSNKRINTIGVVFPNTVRSPILHPYYAPVLDGIMEVALQTHQNTTLFTGHSWIDARQSLPIFRDGRVDGVLLISPPVELDIIPALTQAEMPFVLIDCQNPDPRVNSVAIDDVLAARLMTQHLFELGHRRIFFLSGATFAPFVVLREQGFREAFKKAKLPFDASYILKGDFNPPSIEERANYIASLPIGERPTAVIAANDEMALMLMPHLMAKGIAFPADMSLASFDDSLGASSSTPSLTTIRQPLGEIGANATRILLAHIDKSDAPTQKLTMPIELVIRNSTAPPPS